MIAANMRLVVALARKFSYRIDAAASMSFEDLLQEGCLVSTEPLRNSIRQGVTSFRRIPIGGFGNQLQGMT